MSLVSHEKKRFWKKGPLNRMNHFHEIFYQCQRDEFPPLTKIRQNLAKATSWISVFSVDCFTNLIFNCNMDHALHFIINSWNWMKSKDAASIIHFSFFIFSCYQMKSFKHIIFTNFDGFLLKRRLKHLFCPALNFTIFINITFPSYLQWI